jgi:DNA-binding IclR family transcriptional regulator
MVLDPILSDLRDKFGEAAIMGVPANGTMVYLAFFSSLHVIMVRERLGTTRPMHCSALGKAYLSALDDRALDSELAVLNYQGGTERAARGPIELRERLDETRKRGYAIDRDETFEGGTCVAVPARIGGTLVGAIGLSGPSSRISDQRIAEMGRRLMQVSLRLAGSQR